MTDAVWRTVGAARFVESALDALADHGCLIIELPERLRDSFAEAFAAEARRQDVWTLRTLDLRQTPAGAPGELIARHALPAQVTPGLNAARDLPRDGDLESELLWIDGLTAAGWRDWDVFLRAFARERASSPLNDPYAIALTVPPGLAARPKHAALLRWTGALRRADTALFAAEAMIGRDFPLLGGPLAELIVIETAGWNLDLAATMAQADERTLADPLPWLEQAPLDPPEQPREAWDGADFVCSLALARAGEAAALRRRLWRAHLAGVFPRLEEIRIDAAARNRDRLARHLPWTAPWNETIEDPEDLEIGHMLRLIGRDLDRAERDLLQASKRMRDRLAHRSPVDPDDLLLLGRAVA